MTTARERADREDPPAWDEVGPVAGRRGIPWWAAVLLALVASTLGVVIDLQRIDSLGVIFQGAYFMGCLTAVVLVTRRGLFGPMVQPPLIIAVALPGVVLLSGGGGGGGLSAQALSIGTPLINGFPTMAITTGTTILVGIFRIITQRPPRTETQRSVKTQRPTRDQRPAPTERPAADRPARTRAPRPARASTDDPPARRSRSQRED